MGFKIDKIPAQTRNQKGIDAFNFEAVLKREIKIFGSSFSNKIKEAFYTELNVLLNSGISLKESLSLISDEQKKIRNKELLNDVIDLIISGSTLSEAMSLQNVFTEYEYFSIKIGEETGSLSDVVQELAAFYKRRNEQRRNLLNALSYPLIVMFTALIAVFFMLHFVVPMFVDIFNQNKLELPWITKIIINISNGLKNYFVEFVFVFILLFILKKIISKSDRYKRISSYIILKTPYLGQLTRKVYISQFTQACALLLKSKVPLLNCIELTQKMIPFFPLQIALKSAQKEIINGVELSTCFANHSIFDRKIISLLRVAEQTNKSEFVFKRLTEQYNEDVQYQSKLLSTVLEPVIIIVLGGIVGVILIAMYLPMFKLSSVIG